MMMRRRRRRMGPKWTYSDSVSMSITSAGPFLTPGGLSANFCWLLPPGRAQFLMNTKMRDRMQFSGAHLWLDFFWKNTAASQGLNDVNLAVYKTEIIGTGDVPDFSPMDGQWKQPSTPSNITSWNEDDDDGGAPFLWQHWIKGSSPPNAEVRNLPTASGGTDQALWNQSLSMLGGNDANPTYMCRKFLVTQEWQPDVVIRSKRRIQKGEGIALVMTSIPPGVGLASFLNIRLRTLTL